MTVSLQIEPDIEERLTARARSAGESLEAYILRLLEREASAPADSDESRTLTGAQKAEAFRAWAKSFPPNMPLLGLEDITREKLYERD